MLAELARLGARGDGPSVAGVREREHLLQTTRALDGCRVAIGEEGTLGEVMGPQWGRQNPVAISNPIYADADGGGFKAKGDTLGKPLPVKAGKPLP